MNTEIITISNCNLAVQINPFGASLSSIRAKHMDMGEKQVEYLWQGDPRYWVEQAPNLFPYVGRLTDGCYQLDGKVFQMDIHGFAKNSMFKVIKQQSDEVVLSLWDDSCTYEQYPRHFLLNVIYHIVGKRLDVTFQVKNQDDKEMYFGIGGHPGFNVPLEDGLCFEDYILEFSECCQPKKISFSADHFVGGDLVPYVLQENRFFLLSHELFDEDALVLTDIPGQITLKSAKGKRMVRVIFPDMTYLGIWHAPRTDAPYVCIEPWSSLPARKGVLEDLRTQPGLVHLLPGKTYTNTWSIEIL